jgi:hypothetical protein
VGVCAMSLTFTVLGQPIPQPRSRSGGRKPYVPDWHPVRAWKELIGYQCYAELIRRGWGSPAYTGSVVLSLILWGARANADLDNLAKSIMDALTGIAYGDDRQIMKLTIERRKVDAAHPAGAYIEIDEA